MLKDITSYDGIYLACGATDLRRSVDGLAVIVKHEFKMDPFGNYLFLFCNKNRNRLKALSWDRNGFILINQGDGSNRGQSEVLRTQKLNSQIFADS